MATATVLESTITIEAQPSTEAPGKASFWQRAKARALDIGKRIASPIAAASRTTAKAVKTAAVTTAKAVKRTTLKVGAAVKRTAKAVVTKVRGPKVATTATKVSFGQRAKARAKRLAERMAARQRAIRASFSSPTSVVGKVRAWLRNTWRRVVRPFLKLRVIAFAIVIGAIALVIAPLQTLVTAFIIGAGLWALSYVVEQLEASSSRFARMALKVIEAVAQLLKALAYLAAAALTVFMAMGSAAFAIAEALELVLRYYDRKDAVSISTLVYFLLSGNWAMFTLLAMLEMTAYGRSSARRRAVETQTVKAEYGNRRTAPVEYIDMKTALLQRASSGASKPVMAEQPLTEVPRRMKLPKCSACGIDDGGARLGLRNHKNLCNKCFDALDAEDALKAAKQGKLQASDLMKARKHGVKVPAPVANAVATQPANQRVNLSLEEIEKLSAVANSRDDLSKIHWAETARWYDRDGKPHGREWLGFVDGKSVAAVEYLHDKRNRGFEAWLLGVSKDDDRKVGMFHTQGGAQNAVADALTDQAIVVGGMLDALSRETPATAVVEEAVVLTFHEAKEFASPELHIAHVRATQGDAAATALEEQYLREMIAKEATS